MTTPNTSGTKETSFEDPLSHSNVQWRLRFWAIFSGQSLSLVGSALTQFILLWWIADTTGSIATLAIAGTAALLPQALINPLGGTFADRYSRRILMIVADTISALCMLVLITLFLTECIKLWHVFTMMFIRSTMQAFQMPAASASVAMLVPRSFLSRAAGLNQTMQGMTLVAAAPLGALAISVMPLGWALSIDVFTALLGCLPLLIYRIPQILTHNRAGLSGIWGEFKEGVNLVWSHPGLRRLYVMVGIMMVITSPAFTLVPLLVKTHFEGGAPEVAFIESMAGVGIILGGLGVAFLAPRRKISWMLWGLSVSCFAIALTGLMPVSFFGVAALFWMVSSLAFILGEAPLTVLLQSSIPNHQQGRVLSLMSMLLGLGAPVGLALTTPVGELIGVRWLYVGMGSFGGLVCLLGFFSIHIRRLEGGISH